MLYLSENLRHLRKTFKISQQKLSDQTNIPRSRIAAYESKNVEPRLEVLIQLADYFNVSLDQIVREKLREKAARGIKPSQAADKELLEKISKLEKLVQNRTQRLQFLWQEQEKSIPAIQTAISELQNFQLLTNQALQLCKSSIR